MVLAQLAAPAIGVAAVPPTPAANPPLANSCGIDIALVLDNSASISSSELTQMRNAMTGFVTNLSGTPAEYSVTKFNTTASVVQAFTSVVATVNGAINGISTSSGYTNWQDALADAQGTFSPDPRPAVPNLVIFASDGQPNRWGDPAQGTGVNFNQTALDHAITTANAIKSGGTRIITLGIGSDVNQTNLEAISSADAYYSAADFGQLASTLQEIATDLCGGHLTVTKRIGTPDDWEAAGTGWTFSVGAHSVGTDANGMTEAVDLDNGTYDVTETGMLAGYAFDSASCTGSATDNGEPAQSGVTGVEIGTDDIVSCVFYNTPNAGTLTVIKHVINDFGGTASADAFMITVSVGDDELPAFPGSETGTQVTIPAGESFSVAEDGPAGYSPEYVGDCQGTMEPEGNAACTITNTQIDPHETQGSITVIKNVINDNGGAATADNFTLKINDAGVTSGAANWLDEGSYTVSEVTAGGYQNTGIVCLDDSQQAVGNPVELEAGDAVTCTVTNDDIPPVLTLAKNVNGGQAQAADWTLQAFAGSNPNPAVSGAGSAGSNAEFAAGTYALTETSNNTSATANYEQGAWSCQGGILNNDEITVAIGETANCSITNTYVAPPAPTCGDGEINQTSEQCDDNNTADGDGCSATCQIEQSSPPVCGNEIVEEGEQCDDGNTANNDGCSATCQLEQIAPVCGNGTVESGETCDDGNTASGDGCSATCQIEQSSPPVCGNEIVEEGEQCDGTSNCTSQCTFVAEGVCPTSCGHAASEVPDGKGGTKTCAATSSCSSGGGGGSSSGGGISGDWAPGFGPHGGVTPQVAGASTERMSLDDILAAIARIRDAVASLAAQVAALKGSVLGAATMVNTGVGL